MERASERAGERGRKCNRHAKRHREKIELVERRTAQIQTTFA